MLRAQDDSGHPNTRSAAFERSLLSLTACLELLVACGGGGCRV